MYTTQLIQHHNQRRIAVYFAYDREKYNEIRAISGSRWSPNLKAWHLPDNKVNRKYFGISLFDNGQLAAETVQKLDYFEHWMRAKRYSENTIKTYMEVTVIFLTFFNEKPIEEINHEDVIYFNNVYILEKKLSNSYQNQIVNGIKLFFRTIEHHSLVIQLVLRPKRERRLPHVLSKREVKAILEAPINLKHQTMLSMIYACGLRSGELLSLRPSDILSDRYLLHIHQSKGKKDRIVPISDKIIALLRQYYKAYRPKHWLFEGQEAGKPYGGRSLQLVMRLAVKKAKVNKPATLHWLRHSYATHLLESGTDLRYIQEILGHRSSRTTEIYTHVSNRSIQQIKSPFDDL